MPYAGRPLASADDTSRRATSDRERASVIAVQHEDPRSVQLVGGFLLLLSALSAYGFIVVLSAAGLPLGYLLRQLVATIAMAASGWWLVRRIVWGYPLGLAIGGYWLRVAARVYRSWSEYGSPPMVAVCVYLGLGCVLLGGLLMPSYSDGSEEPGMRGLTRLPSGSVPHGDAGSTTIPGYAQDLNTGAPSPGAPGTTWSWHLRRANGILRPSARAG